MGLRNSETLSFFFFLKHQIAILDPSLACMAWHNKQRVTDVMSKRKHALNSLYSSHACQKMIKHLSTKRVELLKSALPLKIR